MVKLPRNVFNTSGASSAAVVTHLRGSVKGSAKYSLGTKSDGCRNIGGSGAGEGENKRDQGTKLQSGDEATTTIQSWYTARANQSQRLRLGPINGLSGVKRPRPFRPLSQKTIINPPSSTICAERAFSGHGDLKVLSSSPLLVQIDNFISQDELQGLIDLAMWQEFSYDNAGVLEGNDQRARTCTGAWFNEAAPSLLVNVEERMSRCIGWPRSHQEPTHLVHYEQHQEYWPHSDFIPEQAQARCGGRIASALLYLMGSEEGGETSFPMLNLKIKPKAGRFVFWYNVLPTNDARNVKVDERMLHAGSPVTKGSKLIIAKWFHPFPFQS